MEALALPATRRLAMRPPPRAALDRDRPAAPDAQLMAWAAQGDRPAFDALVGRHLPRVLAITRRIMGAAAPAEDAAQETFLRAWQQAARFDPARGELSAWLARIATNIAIDALRSQRAGEPVEAAEAFPSPAPDPETGLVLAERQAGVAAAFAALPARQKAALALVYDQGLPGEDAAEALDITPRALEGLLYRARRLLAARLRGDKP